MATSNFSETFESSSLFEKASPWIRGAVAGAFLGAGIGTVVVEAKELIEAKHSPACNVDTSSECEAFTADQREDIPSSLGGLAVASMAAGLVLYVSRKEERSE